MDEQKPLGYPGRIFVWEGKPMDCIVLAVSKLGANLSVDNVWSVPDSFILMLSQAGNVRRKCTVVRRSMNQIGVQFD